MVLEYHGIGTMYGADEVVLVGVLRRFDRGVGLRRQSRCGTTALVDIALGPGAHHADVEDPRVPGDRWSCQQSGPL